MKRIIQIALVAAVVATIGASCGTPQPVVEKKVYGSYTYDEVKTDLCYAYAKHVSGEGYDGWFIYFTPSVWENSISTPKKYVRVYVPTARMGTDIALVEEKDTEDYWDFIFQDKEAGIKFEGVGVFPLDVSGGTYNGMINGNKITFTGSITFDIGKTLEINYEGPFAACPDATMPAFDESLNNQWKYEGQVTSLTNSYYIDESEYGGSYFVVSNGTLTGDDWDNLGGKGFAFWASLEDWGTDIDASADNWWELYYWIEGTDINYGAGAAMPEEVANMVVNVNYEGSTMTMKANVLFADETNLQIKYTGTPKEGWEDATDGAPAKVRRFDYTLKPRHNRERR